MYPHRIRLRHPWQLDDSAGPVRMSRRFGYPGRIDADERVWLLIEGLAGPGAVALNGIDLGPATGDAAFDVTALLRPRNEVVVELPAGPTQEMPWREVCLEVRRTAYLQGVTVRCAGEVIEVRGRVVGQSAAPLELYVVADRTPVAYTSLTELQGEHAFHLSGPVTAPVALVKVELVQGAVVWYAEQHAVTQGSGA
jgi:hypothetical protein